MSGYSRIGGWAILASALTFTPAPIVLAQDAAPAPSVAQILKPSPSTQPGQSATLLPDGRWLLAGGQSAEGAPLATASIIDARTVQSTELPARMLQARAAHSATLLADGTVLIFGGIAADGTVLDSAERFDPANGSFQALPSLGLIARAQHTATLLSNGRLLIVGGVDARGSALYDVELYDTFGKGVESFNAKLETARLSSLAALLPANTVLLWGGVDAGGNPLPGAELFDPAQGRFIPYTADSARALAASLEGTEPPSIVATEPVADTQSMPVDSTLSVLFSKRLDVTTLNAQTVVLIGAGGALDARITPAETGVLLFVTPARQLLPASHYTLFISGARDPLGQELPFTAVGFRTAAVAASSDSASAQPDAPATAPPQQEKKSPGAEKPPAAAADADDDDDEWIPGGPHFKGDWRTGRARERMARTPPRRAEVLRAIHGLPSDAGASTATGVTAVAGQVLRLNGRPLADVTLYIGSQSVKTDVNGEFLLNDVPAGGQTLVIDGSTAGDAQRRYGRYEYRMNVRAGQLNALPFVIWMTRLDARHAQRISSPTRSETVVATPRIPGLELRIPAGKVIRDSAGRIVTEISITAIPVDQPPFPLPNVPVPVYFTIQPGGAHLEDVAGNGAVGARLIYPNFSGAAPGSRMDFWNYDSRDRGWYVYGQGSVSKDGKQTIPDPGVAIYEFTGAMIGGPGLGPASGPPPGGCQDGDPVDCFTGLFLHERVDLRINDVVPIEVSRTYRPQDTASRAFGIGTMLSYDIFLVGNTDPWSYQELLLPDGGRVRYNRTSPGWMWTDAVYEHAATPTRFHGSTISWNGAGWTLRLRDGTTYKFPEAYQTTNFRKGAAIQIADRFGNAVNLARDTNGNLTEIVSPNGRSIFLAYDGSHRITQARDDTGRTVTYAYDASGRLESATDPLSGVEQYTYDTSHRMLTVRDKRNNVMVTNVYDTNGRVQSQTYADNRTNTFAYTLNGTGEATQLDITDERGFVKRMTFNAKGYPLTITRALGQTEQQVFTNVIDSATNLVTSRTDALGRNTAFQYDAKGNMTQMTLLSGTGNAVSWNYTYDPVYNQIATVTDPLNHTTTFAYDSSGNLTSITDPLNHVTQMSYTGTGQLASITDALSHTTSFGYVAGDVSTVTDALGRTVSFTTDALGRVVLVTDPLGNRTTIAYDALDRVTSRTDPLGHQVSFGYDPNSNLTSFTDARSNVTAFAYDPRNRLITKTDALTQAQSYQYDESGNLSFVTDRKGQIRGFTYDGLGRRTQAGFGATSTISPVYDSIIAYTYDAGNRLTQLVDSLNGTITRQYDNRFNTVTQEVTPQGTVDYVYDAAGRRSSMTPSGGTQVTYTHDNANRLTQIAQGSSTVGFAYDAASRRTTLTLANGVTLTYGYDSANQLTGITYRDGASTLLGDLTYGYDLAGRRTSSGGSFARTGLPDAIASATYDANNRLTNWNGTALSHDANGNLLGFGGNTYTWNKRDQLSAISGMNTASFQYDGVGRRQAKTVSGTNTQFLYDTLNPIQEKLGSTITASILTGLGIDEFLARTEGANSQHFLTDALGSTVRLTNGLAAKIVDYTYEPYGNTTADAGSTNAFQYTGRENDGTGLYYYRARYQHPVLGRFISEDPIGFAGGDNIYAYVEGDPVAASDPLGLRRIPREIDENLQNLPDPSRQEWPGLLFPQPPPCAPNLTPQSTCWWDCPPPGVCNANWPQTPDPLAPAPGCIRRCSTGPFIGPPSIRGSQICTPIR
jgi:RHS repeat-associated protein